MPTYLNIPAAHFYVGRILPIDLIVVHCTESDAGTARAVAGYFASPSSRGSTQWVFDDDTGIRCVADENTPWAAIGHNSNGLHYELCGRASWSTSTWMSHAAMLALAAKRIAHDMSKYRIPYKYPAPILNGKARNGIHGHGGLPGNDHTDPGPNFPWPTFLGMIRGELGLINRLLNHRALPALSEADREKREAIGILIRPVTGGTLRARGWTSSAGMLRWFADDTNTIKPSTIVNIQWQGHVWTNNPKKTGVAGWTVIPNGKIQSVSRSIYRRFAG